MRLGSNRTIPPRRRGCSPTRGGPLHGRRDRGRARSLRARVRAHGGTGGLAEIEHRDGAARNRFADERRARAGRAVAAQVRTAARRPGVPRTQLRRRLARGAGTRVARATREGARRLHARDRPGSRSEHAESLAVRPHGARRPWTSAPARGRRRTRMRPRRCGSRTRRNNLQRLRRACRPRRGSRPPRAARKNARRT